MKLSLFADMDLVHIVIRRFKDCISNSLCGGLNERCIEGDVQRCIGGAWERPPPSESEFQFFQIVLCGSATMSRISHTCTLF